VPESPALLVDPADTLLAVGRLLLAPYEMRRLKRGVAVRVTAHVRGGAPAEVPAEQSAADAPLGRGSASDDEA
jgi:hypothetical protein